MFIYIYQNAMEGSPGHNLSFESSLRSEKGRTSVERFGVGKWLNKHRRCEVLLTNDPRSLTSQFPVGKGARLGSGIVIWVDRLECLPD